MKHTTSQPASIHPLAIGTWVRSAKTGAVGQVVGIHIRSGCSEEPAAVSWPHCEHPFFMYDLQIGDGTTFYGPDTLELTEAPTMTQDTPNETAPAPAPDPWNVATPATVEAVKAEVAAIEEEAGEQVKAAFDEAAQARAQLAGAVAVINADTDALAVLRSKRARALTLARTYRKRWQVASASAREARARLVKKEEYLKSIGSVQVELAKARAELDTAQHALANSQTAVAMLQGNLNAAHLKNAELESTIAHKHAGELSEASETTGQANELAAARERIAALEARLGTKLDGMIAEIKNALLRNDGGMYFGELQKMVRGEELNAALTEGVKRGTLIKRPKSNYYTLPEFSDRAQEPEPQRDEVADLMAVLREYGFEAYANGQRANSAEWLRKRLANIGEPVQGGAVKPAAG